jgi:hypothetical protein
MPPSPRSAVASPFLRFAGGLRFPWLFALTLIVFLIDLAVPDLIPFADEVLLGLATLVLAGIRRKRSGPTTEHGPAA